MHRCALLALSVVLLAGSLVAQERPTLTVDLITQAPETWIGAWPGSAFWTDDGQHLYFSWNPRGAFRSDSLFRVPVTGGEPVRLTQEQRRNMPPAFQGWHQNRRSYSPDFSRRVYERNGDVYLFDLRAATSRRLTETRANKQRPVFSVDGRSVYFVSDDNVFAMSVEGGSLHQLTDIRTGRATAEADTSEVERYLLEHERRLLDFVRERREDRLAREAQQERDREARQRVAPFYLAGRNVGQLQVDPTGRFVTFTLSAAAEPRQSQIMNYVTESGFAQPVNARAKVGMGGMPPAELYVMDLERDTTYQVDFTSLPGFFDAADFARERGQTRDTTRQAVPVGPYWSYDGSNVVLDVRTADNKDRWIARLDPITGALTSLDRQRDEAWVAGPGIAWVGGPSNVGFMPDNRTFWFQSEATGHSHLYTVDVRTRARRALTSGAFEVHSTYLSQDGRTWLLQTNEGSPYEQHVYRMPATGGARERLTTGEGRFDLAPHPTFEHLGLLFSTADRPPEVYLQRARRGDTARRITDSPTAEWLAYPWRPAEIIEIPASDGVGVPARIYRPDQPNGAAVIFVHGAGYLQNVHRWWSSYFREYMFHNMLADMGYVVLDLDFRASAGYGRDWRTAVYRYMGGRDLQDHVDASVWLRNELGVPPERVGIYGGSYGGFIVLMGLFTEAEHFGAGAAMRSVTDWSHYNHPYTANILNTPVNDPEAFRMSSPIEFAEGLQDPLLMTHGLMDDNVQPQDIFRLAQRLIELGKRDWELAVHPVEPHGYTEPSSWRDKLHRILELFERNLHSGEARR